MSLVSVGTNVRYIVPFPLTIQCIPIYEEVRVKYECLSKITIGNYYTGEIMDIISLLRIANQGSTESYYQDTCESCGDLFNHGSPIHTLSLHDPDRPVCIICDNCFNVTDIPILHKS